MRTLLVMKRARLGIAAGLALMLATASAGIAAGIGAGLPVGHTIQNRQFAAGGIGDNNNNFIQFSGSTGSMSFRLRGGGTITEDATMVTVSAFTANGLFGFGCWVVPASTFNVTQSLGASLVFDSTAPGVSECPGFPVGPTLSAFPAPANLSSVEGFTGQVVVSAQWTPASVTDVRASTVETTCGSFRSLDQEETQHMSSSLTAAITSLTVEGIDPTTGVLVDIPLTGFVQIFGFGDVATFGQNMVVNGPSTGSCGPFGN